MIGIYKITNNINNKSYIGKSIKIEQRWKNHIFGAMSHKVPIEQCSPLQADIRKFGIENFTFQVLELCEKEDLNSNETKWIKKLKTFENGYNRTLGGIYETKRLNKLSDINVEQIIDLLKYSDLTLTQISKRFSVGIDTISEINHGHSRFNQFEEYPIRKFFKNKKPKTNHCIDCGALIKSESKRCVKCFNIHQRKVERPSKEELLEMLKTQSLSQLGRNYGVTANAIKKWLK